MVLPTKFDVALQKNVSHVTKTATTDKCQVSGKVRKGSTLLFWKHKTPFIWADFTVYGW